MRKYSLSYKIFSVFNTIFMILIGIIMLYPYLNTVAKSFDAAASSSFSLFPSEFSLEGYKMLLGDESVFRAFFVSLESVICSVALSLLVQFGCAYSLSKRSLLGKNFFVMLFMIPQFISAGVIPVYVMLSKYHLLNNFWVYVVPSLFSFYNVVIIRTFIQSTIPVSLEEAATIDGANELTIFFRIILPLCKPILATIALWIMVAKWNDYTTTLMYVTDSSLYTLQYKMMELIKEGDRLQALAVQAQQQGISMNVKKMATSESVISAQVVLTTLPIICVYPFLQKYFVSGIMMGSVKE